jgi:drug/metabolite transporter (DMT)-like permease
LGIAFAVLWSSAFSTAKVLVTYAPPFTISAVRFGLAALLAGGIALALRQPFPRGMAAVRPIILLGLCQNTAYLGLFFSAMTTIPAGLAAIIASAMPLIVAAFAPLVVKERIAALKLVGLMLGFAGVIWVMGSRIVGGIDTFGVALAVFGTAALAVATLTVKLGAFGTGMLMLVASQMAVGAAGCLVFALLLEDPTAITFAPTMFALLGYQVVFPGIIATLLWFTLVKRISTAGASAFHFLNPIFGVGFAMILLGEPADLSDALGVALVAAGILLVNRPTAVPAKPRDTQPPSLVRPFR